jgi:hypothetical protein
MSFEHPQGLWLLALGVPIVVFHFYKGRIRRLEVPSLLFWEQVLVEEERRTALRKLRHVASLLLNLAAVVVLTSAVSDPRLRDPARYALLIDNTASMAALGSDGRTRHAAAIDRARAFLLSRGIGDQASVHDLSGARWPFTSDLEGLARRIAPSAPGGRTDLRERVLGALGGGGDVTAVLFTDRIPGGLDDLLRDGRLRIERVGAPADNAGWTAGLQLRRPGEKRVRISLTLGVFGGGTAGRSEVLRFNRNELARRPAAEGAREWTLDPAAYPGARIEEGGLVEVALEPADAFPADDVASWVLAPLVPPPVIVFHPGSPEPHLMHALHTLRAAGFAGEVNAAPAGRLAELAGGLGEGWVVILDRVAPPAGEGAFLVFGAPGGPVVERPAIADWDRESPVNRLVDYAGLAVRRSRILEGPALLRAVEGPIATWSARGGRAVVEFGFSLGPDESDLTLRPAFLTMLFNAIEWAGSRGTRAFPAELAAGEPVRAERPLWIEEGELLFEQSGRVERILVRKGRAEAAPSAAPGFVRLSAGGRSEWSAANLFDAGESDLRAPAGAAPGPPPPEPWHARVPYAALAVAVVLALLLLEAWLFYRGVI